MDFAAASVLPLKRYAEFGGRSTRTEWIGFTGLSSLGTGAILLAAERLEIGWTPPEGARA